MTAIFVDTYIVQEWKKDGWWHRTDGPAVIEADGTERWFINGKRHRSGGPAVEKPNGAKVWFRHGLVHREDGPAVTYDNGKEEFWAYDKKYTNLNEWAKRVGFDMDSSEFTLMKMQYG